MFSAEMNVLRLSFLLHNHCIYLLHSLELLYLPMITPPPFLSLSPICLEPSPSHIN